MELTSPGHHIHFHYTEKHGLFLQHFVNIFSFGRNKICTEKCGGVKNDFHDVFCGCAIPLKFTFVCNSEQVFLHFTQLQTSVLHDKGFALLIGVPSLGSGCQTDRVCLCISV